MRSFSSIYDPLTGEKLGKNKVYLRSIFNLNPGPDPVLGQGVEPRIGPPSWEGDRAWLDSGDGFRNFDPKYKFAGKRGGGISRPSISKSRRLLRVSGWEERPALAMTNRQKKVGMNWS
jgi:hypothetical protein